MRNYFGKTASWNVNKVLEMFHIDGLEHDKLHTLHPVCAEVLQYWKQSFKDIGGTPKLTNIGLMGL